MAPVKAGAEVGKARVIVGGKTVAEVSVLTASEVPAIDSMLDKAMDSLSIMVFGG